jgi:hypothetical protein
VMKLEANWFIEAANHTGPAQLFDQAPTRVSPPALHGLNAALETTVVAVRAKRKRGHTVLATGRFDALPRLPRLAVNPLRTWTVQMEPVFLQPVPHGCGTAIKLYRQLANREPIRDEPSELCFVERPTGCMSIGKISWFIIHLQAFSAADRMDYALECVRMQGICGGRSAEACRNCESGPAGL